MVVGRVEERLKVDARRGFVVVGGRGRGRGSGGRRWVE